ncbi:hypothetical protein EYR40_009123 [Pleurotus pulmonarius]|nr:hypothetical protein EYR40_009123 [Pleurotus pulmonarius]
MGPSGATQASEPLAAATAGIDNGGLPPKLGRMGRKLPPPLPTGTKSANGEPAAGRVYDGEVKEVQIIDADVDASVDSFGLPPKLRRARRVPQATPDLATGLPPKVRRAWGNIPPAPPAPETTAGTPSSSRATIDGEASHLPTKLRRAHNIPPPPTNLEPATAGSASTRVELKDSRAAQGRPTTPRAGLVEIASSAPYLPAMLSLLRAHGIILEAPAAADSEGDDTESDDEEAEDYSVFAEKKVSWKVLCRLIKPARRVAKPIPVRRELRSAAKGKKKEEPADGGKATESTADKEKAKEKNISAAVKVAIRAVKRVAEAKAGEQTVSTRRRKAAVKTTIRAKKIVQAKGAGRKPSTRGRGAAKAAVTGNAPTTRKVKLIVHPPKNTGQDKPIAGERPPLSASGAHNTPGKASGHKESESISERPRPAFRLPETKEVASGKAPRRSTRSAGKLEAPGASEVQTMKPGAGRSKRKETHEGGREERDDAKRIKTNDAKPIEDEPPRPKLMIRIPKRPPREDIAVVRADIVEGSKAQPETIQKTVENDESKLRRSARSKKPSFKTRQQ